MALFAAHNPIFSMICSLVFILCHKHFRLVQEYYSLYNWIGEHEITKLKTKYLLRIQKKGRNKKHKKT